MTDDSGRVISRGEFKNNLQNGQGEDFIMNLTDISKENF